MMFTHLGLWSQGSVRSCFGSVPAPHRSAAGRQTARSPVWLVYPAPGTHLRSECQHSCSKKKKDAMWYLAKDLCDCNLCFYIKLGLKIKVIQSPEIQRHNFEFLLSHLCWKKFSRALQMMYLSWMVSRCSSCWPKVRPWTLILGGRISATHCRELSTGEWARSARRPPPARSCSVWGKEGGPSSTTKVGMAPLPCSMDTTFSWAEVLKE